MQYTLILKPNEPLWEEMYQSKLKENKNAGQRVKDRGEEKHDKNTFLIKRSAKYDKGRLSPLKMHSTAAQLNN